MSPLTAEQRVERAKNAVAARWARSDWAKMPLDDAIAGLAELREEYERAAHAVQLRMVTPAIINCFICKKEIPQGKWTQNIIYRDRVDQLIKTIYFDSARCISAYNKLEQAKRFPDAPAIKDEVYLPK